MLHPCCICWLSPTVHFDAVQEGEEGEEDDSDDSGDRERITDVSELARMASRGAPNVRRVSPVAAVRRCLALRWRPCLRG